MNTGSVLNNIFFTGNTKALTAATHTIQPAFMNTGSVLNNLSVIGKTRALTGATHAIQPAFMNVASIVNHGCVTGNYSALAIGGTNMIDSSIMIGRVKMEDMCSLQTAPTNIFTKIMPIGTVLNKGFSELKLDKNIVGRISLYSNANVSSSLSENQLINMINELEIRPTHIGFNQTSKSQYNVYFIFVNTSINGGTIHIGDNYHNN